MSTLTPLRKLRLEDRYEATSGEILLDGMQAIVRMMLDLRALDARRGHDTGVFVSGYPGSPLGGLDLELERNAKRIAAAGIVFQPGLNEELAATAVAASSSLRPGWKTIPAAAMRLAVRASSRSRPPSGEPG